MTTHAARTSPSTSTSFVRWATAGAGAGIIASLAMAMYAMVTTAFMEDKGFFTPLYHIATTFISPSYMMDSVGAAADGSSFTFFFGPAILGALIHMMIGAGYGVAFAIVAKLLSLHGAILAAVGAVYGFLVFVASTWVLLPLTAAILSVDDMPNGNNPIADMPTMVGYPHFITEHIIFGLVLAILLIPVARKALANR